MNALPEHPGAAGDEKGDGRTQCQAHDGEHADDAGTGAGADGFALEAED
jgi:putative uncharacterized protein (fragment)